MPELAASKAPRNTVRFRKFRYLAWVVRYSLAAVVVMVATSGCLILGDPEVEEPVRGEPQLIATLPPTTELIRVVTDDTGAFPVQTFKALLSSEDAGEPIRATLLINYGIPGPGGVQPWQGDRGSDSLEASTADDLRELSLRWSPTADVNAPDCKSVTMVVTHEPFDKAPFEWCPVDPNDVARLTWFVAFCEAGATGEQDCDFNRCLEQEPETGYQYCPSNVEQAYQDWLDGGGG